MVMAVIPVITAAADPPPEPAGPAALDETGVQSVAVTVDRDGNAYGGHIRSDEAAPPKDVGASSSWIATATASRGRTLPGNIFY